MIIFTADDPLVLNGTYDQEGWKPGERARWEKAEARKKAEQARCVHRWNRDGMCTTCLLTRPQPQEEEPMAKRSKSAKAAKPAKKKPTTSARRPRQQPLGGMEDSAIKPLEEAAAEYADIRDQRMALNQEEAGLKAKLLRLMKKYAKTTYQRDGISIEVVTEEETVKVRVKKAGDDEADEAQQDQDAAEAENGGAVAEDGAEA